MPHHDEPARHSIEARWEALRAADLVRRQAAWGAHGDRNQPEVVEPDHSRAERWYHQNAREQGRVSMCVRQSGDALIRIGTEAGWRDPKTGWRADPVPELPRVNPHGSSGAMPVLPEAVCAESTRWGNRPWVRSYIPFKESLRPSADSVDGVIRGLMGFAECNTYIHLGDDVRGERPTDHGAYPGPRGFCTELAREGQGNGNAPGWYLHPANKLENDAAWASAVVAANGGEPTVRIPEPTRLADDEDE